MSSQIMQRDTHFGTSQAWHGATTVREKLLKKEVYPYQVETVPLYRPLGDEFVRHEVRNEKNNGHSGEFKGARWVTLITDDDGLPVGNGQPVNPETYLIRTPQEDWDFLEEALAEGGHRIVSAGTVKNRSRHFIVAELEESSVFIGHREFGGFFNFLGGLDRQTALRGVQSTVCTVCWNTMSWNIVLADARIAAAVKEEARGWRGAFILNHTRNAQAELDKIKAAIQDALVVSGHFGEAMTDLRDTPCTVDRASEIYTGFLASEEVSRKEDLSSRTSNAIDDLVSLFRDGKGNEGENLLDVLSGMTEYRTSGGFVSRGSRKDPLKRWESSEFGSFAEEKERFGRELVKDRGEKLAARGKAILAS